MEELPPFSQVPDPACEKEVPYFIEDFTLSGGCCADGLAPPAPSDTKKTGPAFESDKLSSNP